MLKIIQIFKSSKAVIDLASVMVGVIVIGLLGGVIAATVFAVIPWTQDKTATQQMESIHGAENAYYGLHAQTGAGLFTDSAGLQANKLLETSSHYCVLPTNSGQNYSAYVASDTGKVFKATYTDKKTKQVINETTCLGTVTDGKIVTDDSNPGNGNGNTDPGTNPGNGGTDPGTTNPGDNGGTPPGNGNGGGTDPGNGNTTPETPKENDYGVPVGTTVANNDFESFTYSTVPTDWKTLSSANATVNPILYLGVKTPSDKVGSGYQTQYRSLYQGEKKGNVSKVLEIKGAPDGLNVQSARFHLKPGTYEGTSLVAKGADKSGWMNWNYTARNSAGNVVATTTWVDPKEAGTAYNWAVRKVTFTVTAEGDYYLNWSGTNSDGVSVQMVDNVAVTKTANAPA